MSLHLDCEAPHVASPGRAPRRLAASFRDPSGFVYRSAGGELLRQVNRCYAEDFARCESSGLAAELVRRGWLIEYEVAPLELRATDEAGCVLRPAEIPFVSYPYEWAFSGLQDAALLTLRIERAALARGMCLKDASAYNVQFRGARPVLIDSLSFERYEPETPWVAYGQFCRHFLAPLALMTQVDVGLGRLLALHLDGIPLALAAKLLPWTSWFNLGLASHVHLHAGCVTRYGETDSVAAQPGPAASLPLSRRLALLDHLESTIAGLTYTAAGTEWADYYRANSYTSEAFEQKRDLVDAWLGELAPRTVWDLGANTGVFSRLASRRGAATLALDIDPACVERNYLAAREAGDTGLLPLWCDLTNPSPGIGWAGRERDALRDRGPAEVVLALALIHHLAIANNVPLPLVAQTLAELGRHAIVEWVPKEDPQTQRLLRGRKDIFAGYSQAEFEAALGAWFEIHRRAPVGNDGRVLYQLRGRSS